MKSSNTKPYHDLIGMMAHCEANYLMLIKLLPTEISWSPIKCSVNAEYKLSIELVENTRYTTTINLHSTIHNNRSLITMNKWPVRLYHDAQLAEVLATGQGHQLPARHEYPNSQMRQPDEKFRLNEHLRDWLKVCLNVFPDGFTAYSSASASM